MEAFNSAVLLGTCKNGLRCQMTFKELTHSLEVVFWGVEVVTLYVFHSFGLCFVFAFKFVVFFVLVGWLIAGCLLLLTSATVL